MGSASDATSEPVGGEVTRRSFVRVTGSLGLLASVPPIRLHALLHAAPAPGQARRYLSAVELSTLTALCDRLIPGPPEDPTPGALQAGVPHAIDLLLGAFEVDPPLIHAGGPFSNRAGHRRDDFKHFVPLDQQAELGWRIRIEGSKGISEREFAGPVKGLQQIYRDGLGLLHARARAAAGVGFAEASTSIQQQLMSNTQDRELQAFIGAAFANTLEAMYGPPEYGGNRGLVGWTSNRWAGDNQPRGYTRKLVSEPDAGSAIPLAIDPPHALPDLSGRPAPRESWWLRRARLGR